MNTQRTLEGDPEFFFRHLGSEPDRLLAAGQRRAGARGAGLLPQPVSAEDRGGRLRTAPNSYAQFLTASHSYLALSTPTHFRKPPTQNPFPKPPFLLYT
jgi:hypothetical protein